MAWFSYQQGKVIPNMDVQISAQGDPMALLPAIRRIIRDLDPSAPLYKPALLADRLRRDL